MTDDNNVNSEDTRVEENLTHTSLVDRYYQSMYILGKIAPYIVRTLRLEVTLRVTSPSHLNNGASAVVNRNDWILGRLGKKIMKAKYFLSLPLFSNSQSKPNEDLCILTHSNRVCIVTVAKSHPLIKLKKKISEINFNVEGTDRLNNKISGKGKRGAQTLSPSSPLCKILCSDGTKYTIVCGIRAQLIEANENLVSTPDILINKPQTDGFIAIVLPKLGEYGEVIKSLSTKEEYLSKRFPSC